MCSTCGCGSGEGTFEDGAHDHARAHETGALHSHGHEPALAHTSAQGHASDVHGAEYGSVPAHAHAPGLDSARMLRIEQDILAKNDAYAAHNRTALGERGIFALNLVSAPGAGKTALLVKTIQALGEGYPISVIEGDQQTSHDAERIRASGARAVQINTGKGCHLDAHMVGHALAQLDPPQNGILMIENVGNLVCPAAFDLGEAHKVVLLSVTEGEDKPLKYPDMFRRASLMLLSKIDLLPHLNFDLGLCVDNAHRTNPDLAVIGVSALTGEGMAEWLAWLGRGADAMRATACATARVERSAAVPPSLARGSPGG
ncbi:MAG TPA: hydrogenase nickel incorporation protein HypB [Burkholderiales bacterium]|nr:hydrogenase nickel incorporation protein HypB [Burkholderiales bacterium]